MISKSIIVAGIAMFLLSVPLSAQLKTTMQTHSISITSEKTGTAGLHGCDPSTASNVPAYLFKLQKRQTSPSGTCATGGVGKWIDHSEKETDNGKVTFNSLPDGQYRIVSLTGEAIGCPIKGTNERSIVYAKEVSSIITIGKQSNTKPITSTTKSVGSSELVVYPNPASTQINIQLMSQELDGQVTITLYDILGKAMESIVKNYAQSTTQTWELSISNLPSGTYLIKVSNENKSLHKKVIVEHEQ